MKAENLRTVISDSSYFAIYNLKKHFCLWSLENSGREKDQDISLKP